MASRGHSLSTDDDCPYLTFLIIYIIITKRIKKWNFVLPSV